ncbi:MAG TPA: acetolactate synthase [Candidatus Dormibacteraeota bacterium]
MGQPDQLSTGDLVALALQRAGTRHLFTLNGGHIWGLLMGAVEHGLHLVDVRNEQTAAFAAEGWSKLTRECGVAAVTAGPGVTNSMSTLAGAWANDSPLLVIGGRSPLATEGMGSLQELDHLPLVRSVTKFAQTLKTPEDAYRTVSEALRLALSARSGPAFLDVPADVFFGSAAAPEDTEHLVPDRGAHPDPDAVREAARLIREARQPAVVAGSGVWWGHAEEPLRRLLEAAGLPAVTNGLARGIVPPVSPGFATRARSVALGEADLVLVVGVPLDFRLAFGRAPVFNEDARLIYVDVDARRRHRPGALALDGDLAQALTALAEACTGRPRHGEWLERVAAATERARRLDAGLAESDSRPIHPARLVEEVRRRLDPDAVVIGDGGDFVSFAGRLIEPARPGLFLEPGPYGCLGTGAGYAMAARLAHPDGQVVVLAGDGAFGFSAMDVETLVRHRLPVVFVIGNNGIWATEKHPMQALLQTAIATDLSPGIRYDRLVESLGGHGELVTEPEQIGPAFERALKSGVPACLNVITDPDAAYPRSAALI